MVVDREKGGDSFVSFVLEFVAGGRPILKVWVLGGADSCRPGGVAVMLRWELLLE